MRDRREEERRKKDKQAHEGIVAELTLFYKTFFYNSCHFSPIYPFLCNSLGYFYHPDFSV